MYMPWHGRMENGVINVIKEQTELRVTFTCCCRTTHEEEEK